MSADIQLSQLVCSRICHDLVGAAGAVNAGIELLHEDASDLDGPLGLMATSAGQLTRRLSFFRVAFGFAGGPDSPFAADDIKPLCEAYFKDKKLTLIWEQMSFDGSTSRQQSVCGKLLMLMCLMASDCLVRGGEARVHLGAVDDGMGIAIAATGTGAAYPDDIRLAFEAEALGDQITSRNVHAFFASQLARSVLGSVEIDVEGENVRIACVIP